MLTAPDSIMLTPITIASGIPSIKDPRAIASPLPFFSFSDFCFSPYLFRCLPPALFTNRLATVYTTAPARNPMAVAINPPRLKASSIRLKERAEINTPLPKAITNATHFREICVKYPTEAPIINAEPATRPQTPAFNQSGSITNFFLPCTKSTPVLIVTFSFCSLSHCFD